MEVAVCRLDVPSRGEQGAQQGHGIGAPAHGDQQRACRSDAAVVFERFVDLSGKRIHTLCLPIQYDTDVSMPASRR